MNYKKKFMFIIISAVGMMIAIVGIAYKTGYFPGHSVTSAYFCMAFGIILTILGLANLRKY